MLRVALVEPEIPPNTGNVARLCAATRTPLHIVGVMGFRLDERAVRRAGLDYWPEVELRIRQPGVALIVLGKRSDEIGGNDVVLLMQHPGCKRDGPAAGNLWRSRSFCTTKLTLGR